MILFGRCIVSSIIVGCTFNPAQAADISGTTNIQPAGRFQLKLINGFLFLDDNEGSIQVFRAQTLPTTTPALLGKSSSMAVGLEAKTECSRTELRKGVAKLSWKVAATPGIAQRVDVSIYRDGFETGKFETVGSLPPSQASLAWERLDPGIIHYYRVLTLHTHGWVASETASFEGPTCVADFQSKPSLMFEERSDRNASVPG
jgi:hypothetical protein